ncbi:HAD-IB family phosphatase [Actomonas aquatica]|uniref:phosphoserine phosphatase n=1 Tax=Actomonas aquatica TaxID=2866162 RepID=A0ABZ1C8N8_9BACT|nr:HAD-IB family phosphatase [Opitutus sp. WL0086]WRQ87949.1 HAD-IB family phosphatase [Opitutus sp. WL0086]
MSITSSGPRLLVIDCDSTLSAIEGVDELARVRGDETFAAVEAMTHDAMDGRLAVEAVFGKRLEIIQPTAAHVAEIGQRYIDTVEPTAAATLATLCARGWTPIILSGGFRPAIRPLADMLQIERVEAVDLYFDADGNYAGYAENYPTTRSGGKPEMIRQLKAELSPQQIVMVGDGVSDLETQHDVDLFVGFGRYVAREKVKAGAAHFVTQFADLAPILG